MDQSDEDADEIADCVLKAFDALPNNRKPRVYSPTRREWVTLAGIVVQDKSRERRPQCVALATGVKCLPQDKIASLRGIALHDSHAEILALRAFNRFLLDQCVSITEQQTDVAPEDSWVVEVTNTDDGRSDEVGMSLTGHDEKSLEGGRAIEDEEVPVMRRPFRIKDDLDIHMYCSEAPCGDASMELTMAAQSDPTPWTIEDSKSRAPSTETAVSKDQNPSPALLHGRGFFGELGVVRRKPSRPDAPATLSKSCSDKLALRQCTSMLNSLGSLFVEPKNAYLKSLILPKSQMVPHACSRAFGPHGRMSNLTTLHARRGSYRFQPFNVLTTGRIFAYARLPADGDLQTINVPSNIASVAIGPTQQTLINGILQGRKQGDIRGASMISRRHMWSRALELAKIIGSVALVSALSQPSYAAVKQSALLEDYRQVKECVRSTALRGWVRNNGDETWSIAEL